MRKLFDQIDEVLNASRSYENLQKEVVTPVYEHKISKEIITSLPEAFEKKVNLSEYEPKSIISNPKSELINMIGREISENDIALVKQFSELLEKLKPVKTVNPFQKKLNRLNAKLHKAKGTDNEKSVREERVKLYIEYNETPRRTFNDFNLWEELSKK